MGILKYATHLELVLYQPVSVHTVDVEAEVLDADPVVVYPQLDEGVEGDLKVGQLVHRVAHYQSQQAPSQKRDVIIHFVT